MELGEALNEKLEKEDKFESIDYTDISVAKTKIEELAGKKFNAADNGEFDALFGKL